MELDRAGQEIIKEFRSSLSDLVVNSRPLIQMLTMLADDNVAIAPAIVDAIEKHLLQEPIDNSKLPVMYLIDSICKNIKKSYIELFMTNLVSNFCAVFEKVDEKVRAALYKLRSTWGDTFPATKLYALDARVQLLDPAWPIPRMPVSKGAKMSSIHVNPKFLKEASSVAPAAPKEPPNDSQMRDMLLKKQRELLELQEKKVALELLQTKSMLEGRNLPLRMPSAMPIIKAPDSSRFQPKSTSQHSASIHIKPAASSQKTVIRPATNYTARPSALESQSSLTLNKDPRLAKTSMAHVQKSNLPKSISELRPDKNSSPDLVILPEPNKSSLPKSTKSPSKRESSHKKESNGKSDAKKSKSSTRSSSSSSSSTSSPSKSHRSSKGSKKDTKSSKKAALPEGKFKDIKSIHLRNYVRKVRSVSSSPEQPSSSEAKIEGVSKPPKQGTEQDVDLRRLATSPTGKKRGSTPDNGADQPSSPKRSKQAEMIDELFGSKDVDLRQLSAPVRAELKKAPDWARFKETNPDTYRSPLKNCNWENGSDISLSDIEIAPPPPLPKVIIPDDKISPASRKSLEFDSLGRPLLHHCLAEETRERRRSNSTTEDVDLRHMCPDMFESEDNAEKMRIMIAQADEQLKNGSINMAGYRELLKEVIQINESNKLREAQKRDEQENWAESWQDEDSQGDESRKHNDVDERYPPRRDLPHRGGRGGIFPRQGRGAWGEGHMQRPQWEENWNRGGPSRPPFMRGGPRGQFQRGGMQSDFGGPRFWGQGPRAAPFQGNFPPPMHQADLPLPDPRELAIARASYTKTLSIDGMARDIRHYGENTIILIGWDDPRDISFYPGERQVEFETGEKVLCNLNGKPVDILVNGMIHKVKLGHPTREVNIDGKDYECYFGGSPITIDVNGVINRIQLEGPAPMVKIGEERRVDYCAGKITLIIDAQHKVPIFLDATPQTFQINGVPHVLKFIEAFKRVSINGQKFTFEYGGLPQMIFVRNQRHYIGFSALPSWIRPGFITIVNMEGGRLPSPPRDELQPIMTEKAVPFEPEGHAPALPMVGGGKAKKAPEKSSSSHEPRKTPLSRSILNTKPQLDVLTNLIQAPTPSTSGYNYQMHQDKEKAADSESGQTAVAPDLAELLAKLNEYGILQSVNAAEAKKKEETEKKEEVYKPVTLKSESLRVRQAGSYANLYCGIQCSTCGLRYPPEQTLKYSQHLDWHFRQNRRDKDSAKKAQSRKWYYDVSDWIQFEEIEDMEERAQSWFETQAEEDKPVESEAEIPTVLAGENNTCEMCHEVFEQLYNNEKDEWHLSGAIRVEDKVYHPACFQDVQKALETTADSMVSDENNPTNANEDVEMKEEENDEEEKHDVKAEAGEEKAPEKEEALEEGVEEKKPAVEEPTEPASEPLEEDPQEKELEQQAVEQTDVGAVKIKLEPLDPDTTPAEPPAESNGIDVDSGVFSQESDTLIKTEPKDAEEEEEMVAPPVSLPEVDTTKSDMDGNVELEKAPAAASAPLGKIKINITTPAPALPEPVAKKEVETPETPSEYLDKPISLSKGDNFELKPKLKGRKLTEMPPVMKGREESALCSIM